MQARVDLSAFRLLVLDVDGVLTDGRLYYSARGEVLKIFDVRDGYGIKRLADAGVATAVISGRRSAMVTRRCRDLGIRHVLQGIEDKLAAFQALCRRLGIRAAECVVVGDDTIDVPMMRAAGLAFAVADAHEDAKESARFVLIQTGGRGAVREVCDRLIAARKRGKHAR